MRVEHRGFLLFIMEEIWKPVVGFEGIYEVSNYGRVKSLAREVRCGAKGFKTLKDYILKQGIRGDRHNRPYVRLQQNGKMRNYTVARLVAEAFIPNPYNLPQVNHKDENPMNNFVGNLEWCSALYNLTYNDGAKRRAESKKLNGSYKRVLQLSKKGDFIKEWGSVMDVAEHYNCDPNSIYRVLQGFRKSTLGYKWKYKDAI